MWSNNGSQDARRSSQSSHQPDDTSPEYAAAVADALARRMVYPNAYDSHLPAAAVPPAGYYEDVWSQQLRAERAREVEYYHLQMQQQAAAEQAFESEAARRSRLLELEISVNQMAEYERCRRQLEMMREVQHHEQLEVDRGRLLVGSAYSGLSDPGARQHQIAEYLAGQRSRAVEDAETWGSSTGVRRQSPLDALAAQRADELLEAARKPPATMNETDLKPKKESVERKKSPAPEKQRSKSCSSGDDSSKKRKAPSGSDSPKKKASSDSLKKKASTDSPKKKKPNNKESKPPAKMESSEKSTVMNGGLISVLIETLGHAAAKPAKTEAKSPPQEEATSPEKHSPDTEEQKQAETPSSTTTTTVVSQPAAQHASKTLAQLKALAESKQSTPPKETTKKRKKTPAKKMDSLATTTGDKPSSGSKAAKKKSPGPAKVKLASPRTMMNHISLKRQPGVPSVDDPVPPITEVQYENVEALMNEFCKVPFLAEFGRPVSLLHPELLTLYNKVVHHPMDLGHVCRAIRRREYKNTRAIQLDMWRIFSNCVKFHTHPSNRDNAIPSFISIANHLRDFFNSLWQEFMMKSDAPPRQPGKGISHIHSAFQKRAEARKERLLQISATVLTPKCMRKVADALESFLTSGGKVDNLDKEGVLGNVNSASGDTATFMQSVREIIGSLEEKIENGEEYTVSTLYRDLKKSYSDDLFATEVLKRMRIGSRIDRLLGKIFVPVHEVNCRGVNQSSIWGNMAAIIWARESKKKPFWPAIVLGMMAPEDQKEDWHESLTERNEARLPEKLREELQLGKRRAEQALKKQSTDPMSYFLVEFMGSHEFIWVRENDIKETFDPEDDPNVAAAAGNVTKKRRSGHSSINSKLMSDAIEEGRWALEEFEILLNDACGDQSDEESEYDDQGYTYDVMCQSDNEADELEALDKRKANDSDVEEQNELLANNGCIDYSIEGTKKRKAKSAELKKQKAALLKQEKEKTNKPKSATKKTPAKKSGVAEDDTKLLAKQLEEDKKREKREAEARRKKRARDHERLLKELEKKSKKPKVGTPDKRSNPNLIPNKKGRAEAFVKSFLIHKHKAHADFHGAPFLPPTNTVDPTDLLGMALSFRAAVGEISFPDHTGKEFIEKPWDKIDASGPKESSERCKRLQQQIDLIEREIHKVNATKDRRLTLYSDATKSRDALYQKAIDAGNSLDRIIHQSAKKKKKSLSKPEPVKSNQDVDVASGITQIETSAASTPDEKPKVESGTANSPQQPIDVPSKATNELERSKPASNMPSNTGIVLPKPASATSNLSSAATNGIVLPKPASAMIKPNLYETPVEAPDATTSASAEQSNHIKIEQPSSTSAVDTIADEKSPKAMNGHAAEAPITSITRIAESKDAPVESNN